MPMSWTLPRQCQVVIIHFIRIPEVILGIIECGSPLMIALDAVIVLPL